MTVSLSIPIRNEKVRYCVFERVIFRDYHDMCPVVAQLPRLHAGEECEFVVHRQCNVALQVSVDDLCGVLSRVTELFHLWPHLQNSVGRWKTIRKTETRDVEKASGEELLSLSEGSLRRRVERSCSRTL